LVLPHDELNYDPDSPAQSFRSWSHEKMRNKLTNRKRNNLYVVRVPEIGREMEFMREWISPLSSQGATPEDVDSTSPPTELFIDYLKAFYHNMNVRLFPTQLSWTTWEAQHQPSQRARLPKYIGLSQNNQCTRIRVRTPPDNTFAAQLNLNDVLDAAIDMLPDDAYALVLLIDHDMYESADDDFCCGRAYGGSRVAVVQSARYNPCLDDRGGIERAHMWPFSHCKDFVDNLCAVEDVEPRRATKQQIASSRTGPMHAAVDAATTHAQDASSAVWFSRLARTVSHELGHCFALGHCVYYACNMQGTAGMKEDVRQPPYLCPVCEAKVAHAIAGELQSGGEEEKKVWVKERCEVLASFCRRLEDEGLSSAMWKGFEGWLGVRMENM